MIGTEAVAKRGVGNDAKDRVSCAAVAQSAYVCVNSRFEKSRDFMESCDINERLLQQSHGKHVCNCHESAFNN